MGRVAMVALSTPPDPDIRDIQAISASLANVALSDGAAPLRRIAGDMRRHVRGIEKDLAEYKRATRSLGQLVADAADDEIDAAVVILLRRERALQEVWAQSEGVCRKLEARARHVRPATYPLVRQITSAALGWYRPYLTFLRDLRWEIMALQAERAPAATGPLMQDGADVDSYFRSLPPAA